MTATGVRRLGSPWSSSRLPACSLPAGRQQQLLRERLGWRFQPAISDVPVVTAAPQPLPTPASPTGSLAAVAGAALADLEDLAAGVAGPARSKRPASPADRRDAIAKAWRDEPGITDTALAERFGVSGRTVQRDIQALQERASSAGRRTAGAEATGPGRSMPPSTGGSWPG